MNPISRLQRLIAEKRLSHSSLQTQAQALLEFLGEEMRPAQLRITSQLAGGARMAMAIHSARGDVYRNARVETPLLVARMLAL